MAAAGRMVAPAARPAPGTAAAPEPLRKTRTQGGGQGKAVRPRPRTLSGEEQGGLRAAHPSSLCAFVSMPIYRPTMRSCPSRRCPVPLGFPARPAARTAHTGGGGPSIPWGSRARVRLCLCVRLKAEAQAAYWYLRSSASSLLPPPLSPLSPPPPPLLPYFPPAFFFFLVGFQAHLVEFLPLSASAPRHFAGSSPAWAGARAGVALLSAGGRRRRCVKRRARLLEPCRRGLRLSRRPHSLPLAGSGRPSPRR